MVNIFFFWGKWTVKENNILYLEENEPTRMYTPQIYKKKIKNKKDDIDG